MSRHILRISVVLAVLSLSLGGCAKLDSGRPVCASCYPKTIRVACVGDSITYGSGIKFRSRDSYPAQWREMAGPQFRRRWCDHAQKRR